MKFKAELIFRFSILLILLVGIIWTAINVLRADAFSQRMQGKLDAIKELRGMKQRQDFIEASFAALAAISNTAPLLSALASATVTGTPAEIRELDSRALGRGWNVKRMEVLFKEVSLNSIADFLQSAETQRPPWRLAECVITASSKADGYGTAALTMETVGRQP
ncbi:MAG: hypothetical protein Q7J98_09245 [Kiritimatiellia bacterium]|nr:hypothetical protein [Kiritimatiellia bacterium]